MEGIQLRAINDGVVVFHQDVAAGLERVENDRTSVA